VEDCAVGKDSVCGDAPAKDCAESALASWAHAEEDRDLSCVARKLAESCTRGAPAACRFAGRMAMSGRGLPRDVNEGLRMLTKGCDEEDAEACDAAARWLNEHARAAPPGTSHERFEAQRACLLGQGDACFRVGLGFTQGQGGYDKNRNLAFQAYDRGCSLGNTSACNNLGVALQYGDGTGRDVRRAVAAWQRTCDLGEASGCANLGYMLEHAFGAPRDTRRAHALYMQACSSGDAYGCLHVDMMAARSPEDPARALAMWQRGCDADDARACGFLGLLYIDGPDGLARDEAKSVEVMSRACELGNRRACEWSSTHSSP
jgi:TPR repeat protein